MMTSELSFNGYGVHVTLGFTFSRVTILKPRERYAVFNYFKHERPTLGPNLGVSIGNLTWWSQSGKVSDLKRKGK